MTKRSQLEPQDSQPAGSRTPRQGVATATSSKVPVQLPLWPAPQRGIPNSILRSALFGIVRRGRRRYVDKETIASWPGITICYTGVKLDQSDLDVWLLAAHLARNHSLGSEIRFSAYSFLNNIGRSQGKQNREWLKSVFTRLTACAVEINVGTRTYVGSLVQEFFLDKTSGEYVLTVNPRLATLFEDGYSLLAWQTRSALRSDLAKWIHCFVRSHDPGSVHRVGVDGLLGLCGSESKNIREFRQRLREAMSELEAIGEVDGWCLSNNAVLEFSRLEAA
ncbi:plasmid replication initiator TrfA [Methylolobus aquaticus]